MIPPKTFMRMTDLLVEDNRNMREDGSRKAEEELDRLQDSYDWPRKASPEQLREWDDLYSRIDSGGR
jgi:hypothetical protein